MGSLSFGGLSPRPFPVLVGNGPVVVQGKETARRAIPKSAKAGLRSSVPLSTMLIRRDADWYSVVRASTTPSPGRRYCKPVLAVDGQSSPLAPTALHAPCHPLASFAGLPAPARSSRANAASGPPNAAGEAVLVRRPFGWLRASSSVGAARAAGLDIGGHGAALCAARKRRIDGRFS